MNKLQSDTMTYENLTNIELSEAATPKQHTERGTNSIKFCSWQAKRYHIGALAQLAEP